jgi:L-asparaginase type II
MINNKLPKIMILATGGTLASLANNRINEHYSSASVDIAEFVQQLPELAQFADVHYEQFVQVLSYELNDQIWLQMAKRIQYLLSAEGFDGVVVTHGTDTLEETAYCLQLTVKTNKPIVLTGAMRPANALGAEGLKNVFNAVLLAASPSAHHHGVLVTLNDVIHSARDVSKMNVHTTDSFSSGELGILGYIQGQQVYFYRKILAKHTSNSEFDITTIKQLPKVDIVYNYAGAQACMVEAAVNAGAVGLISAGVGRGHQPQALKLALASARQKGIAIVRCSRVVNGVITHNASIDDKYDFVVGNTLNPQKARILLALALTKTQNTQEIQTLFDAY